MRTQIRTFPLLFQLPNGHIRIQVGIFQFSYSYSILGVPCLGFSWGPLYLSSLDNGRRKRAVLVCGINGLGSLHHLLYIYINMYLLMCLFICLLIFIYIYVIYYQPSDGVGIQGV